MNRSITSSFSVVCFVWFALLTVPATGAQTVPPLINYQGKLVSSNGLPVSTGDYELRFRIWDAATGGNLVWGPQVFNGQSGPGFGPKVPVVQGWFNVMLGPVDTNGTSIMNAFHGTNRFMEIQLGINAPFSPRQQILSAPYALRAASAATAETASSAVIASTASNLLGQATTGPLTLFVSTNGSDANDGLTANTAKRSIQAAVDALPREIRHSATIQLGSGIFSGGVTIANRPSLQNGYQGDLTISGQDPTNTAVSGGATFCFLVDRADITFKNLTLTGNQRGIWAHHSYVGLGNCVFRDLTDAGVILNEFSHGLIGPCQFIQTGATATGTAVAVYRRSLLEVTGPASIQKHGIGVEVYGGASAVGATRFTFTNCTENIRISESISGAN